MGGNGHGGCGCGGHGHGHGHHHDHDEESIVLTDESGQTHKFHVLEVLTVDDKEYAVLAEPGDEEQAFVLRLETDKDGNEILVDIEDSEEFDRVAQAWDDIQSEDWDEEDDEDDEDDEDED